MGEAARPSRRQGKAQGATLVSKSQRPRNSEGLFRADAQEMIYLLFALTVHLAPRGSFFAVINRNPRLRGPDSLWPLSASPPVAARRRPRQREVSGFTVPTGGEDRRGLGAPLALPDLQVPGALASHLAPRKRARARREPGFRNGACARGSECAGGPGLRATTAPPHGAARGATLISPC